MKVIKLQDIYKEKNRKEFLHLLKEAKFCAFTYPVISQLHELYDQAHGTKPPEADPFLKWCTSHDPAKQTEEYLLAINDAAHAYKSMDLQPEPKKELPPDYDQFWCVNGNEGRWEECGEEDYWIDNDCIFIEITPTRWVKLYLITNISMTVRNSEAEK